MSENTLHFDALVIDGHCDSIGDQLDKKRSLAEESEKGHLDLPRMKKAGIDVQFFACFPPPAYQRHGATSHAMARLDQLHLLAETQPDFTIVRKADDIRQAKATGKIGCIAGLEGAEALDASIGVLRQFYRLGIRNMGMSWNHRNAACDGVAEGRTAGGLTEFGVKVVETCNELGILIDVSHLAPAGVKDILEISQHPILATHSNANTLCEHPRNLTDEQMTAIADKGGVVGVTFVNFFLNRAEPKTTRLENVIQHIEYMLNHIGPDHVAIGSDFDGCIPPEDLSSVLDYPKITQRLQENGHSEATIRKVLGENFLRVFGQVCG
ncbi:MAG: dipeptidase [Chloroflexota bacterium]